MVRKHNNIVTIVGLGPGQKRSLTQEAWQTLQRSKEIYVRTSQHPVVAELPPSIKVHSFDAFYEEKNSFEEVYQAISSRVIALAQEQGSVIYAVPGDPFVAEESVRLVLLEAAKQDVNVRIISGVSFLEPVFAALHLDPFQSGLQIIDAAALVNESQREGPIPSTTTRQDSECAPGDSGILSASLRRIISPESPMLLGQLFSRRLASALKLALLEIYPAEHEVHLVSGAGIIGSEQVTRIPLHELDHREVDHLTCLYIPALDPEQNLASFETLRGIIARLRAPNGCPWDREQTHASLKPYVVEEAYEVLEAIDANDPDKLSEELGDLLLQVVLHAQIGTELDEFTMDDVVKGVGSKMIRRHPHVFGRRTVSGSAEVTRNWEAIKRAERGNKPQSVISAIPKALPALASAQLIQRRAARAGFDWPDSSGVLDKINEESAELAAANTPDERMSELGDVLFSLVNLARWLNVDAEEALRQANLRFLERFHLMEETAAQEGLDFTKLGLDEQNRLWNESKKKLLDKKEK